MVRGLAALKKPASKVTTSGPAAALASRIACRRERGPASFALTTRKAVGRTRPSSDRSRNRAFPGRRPTADGRAVFRALVGDHGQVIMQGSSVERLAMLRRTA